jgi:response regulator NasT
MNQAHRPLRIAVADDEADTRQFFQELLTRLGHTVVGSVQNGTQLVQLCRTSHPDVVITDIRMPELDGLRAAEEITRERPVPIILVTGHHEISLPNGAGAEYIMAYLSKPIKPVDLEAAIKLAILRFGHFVALREEAASLRQALEDRKLIERAKGAIMKRLGVDEDEAFRRLRKLASDGNRRLADVAHEITEAEEMFRQLDRV